MLLLVSVSWIFPNLFPLISLMCFLKRPLCLLKSNFNLFLKVSSLQFGTSFSGPEPSSWKFGDLLRARTFPLVPRRGRNKMIVIIPLDQPKNSFVMLSIMQLLRFTPIFIRTLCSYRLILNFQASVMLNFENSSLNFPYYFFVLKVIRQWSLRVRSSHTLKLSIVPSMLLHYWYIKKISIQLVPVGEMKVAALLGLFRITSSCLVIRSMTFCPR